MHAASPSDHPAALPSAGRIVAFSSIAGAMTVFGQTSGISVFIDSLITDVAVSRAEISTVCSACSLIVAFAMPWVGRRIDQHGSCRVTVAVFARREGQPTAMIGPGRRRSRTAGEAA